MIKFEYVEEYLEVIAGHLDPTTGKQSNWVFGFEPIISLARYDVKVLESMASAVSQNQALTERQGELLIKIVLNYSRQLANKMVDVTPVKTNPLWRIPLRKMDYTRGLTIVDDQLYVKFPFSNELIDQVRTFSKESQGSVTWNRKNKVWTAALTEYNLSWLCTWAEVNKFTIDPAVNHLMDSIAEVEAAGYAMELQLQRNILIVTNATASLTEYINEHCGGFGIDNIVRLVDMSAVLGYTVNEDIAQALVTSRGPRFYNLLTAREIKISPNTLVTDSDFDSVLDYADAVKRWPVVVYEPDLSGRMLTRLRDRYGDDYDKERYIHSVKSVRTLPHIPLVISSAGMVFGGDKQLMIQRAEKIVYCAQDVYNKRNNSKVKQL